MPSAATTLSAEQQEAWFALLHARSSLTAQIDSVLMERHRISFSSFEILCRLKEQEPQSLRTLASQLVSVSPTRASRLVQELIDAGRLRRDADQGDGRVSLISLTPEGRKWTEKAIRTFEAAVITYFVDPLDDDDIAALARIWSKLQAAQTQA